MMEELAHGDISKTMEDLVKKFEEEGEFPENGNIPELDAESEESIKKMIEELQTNPEMQGFMEDIMNKLVSRDILYEPIKEMRELVS
jgi:hypothetical protein